MLLDDKTRYVSRVVYARVLIRNPFLDVIQKVQKMKINERALVIKLIEETCLLDRNNVCCQHLRKEESDWSL